MSRRTLTLLSAFSGLGGLDLGLEAAGFDNVGCIELDEVARKSLKANRSSWKLISPHDVAVVSQNISPKNVGLRRRQLSMLAGGLPCQPFSKAAQWSHKALRGMKDPRAKCLAGFMQLVETFLPSVILIENVHGFVSGKTNALRRLRRSLAQINERCGTKYTLHYWILNAADYGVPQNRPRAIVFAHRGGRSLNIPTPTTREKPVTAWEAFSGLRPPKTSRRRGAHWLRLLPSIPEGENYLWHTPRGGGRPIFGYRTRFWSFLLKLAKDRPSWTIPAQPGPYTGPFHWNNRRLTRSELLRLQSFPASWRVQGSYSDVVRQIGNATPPLLAKTIGLAIAKQLFGTASKAETLEVRKRARHIPAPSPTKPVPKSFHRLIRVLPDHPGPGRGPRPISSIDPNEEENSKVA
jgi:DNA (cytosine-5)-methyltransferase 1